MAWYHRELDLKNDVSHICNEGLCVNLKHMSHKDQTVNLARSNCKDSKKCMGHCDWWIVFNSCIITIWATFYYYYFFFFFYDSNTYSWLSYKSTDPLKKKGKKKKNLTTLFKSFVTRYSKRYLMTLATSYWFRIFSHKRAAVFSSQRVECKL